VPQDLQGGAPALGKLMNAAFMANAFAERLTFCANIPSICAALLNQALKLTGRH
jgi:hypothetical protein